MIVVVSPIQRSAATGNQTGDPGASGDTRGEKDGHTVRSGARPERHDQPI
jgi:hypothetical protein